MSSRWHLARDEGAEAERLAKRAAGIAGRTQDMHELVRSAETLGAVAAWRGDHAHARRLLSSAAAFRARLHLIRSQPEQDRFEATLESIGSLLDPLDQAVPAMHSSCDSLAALVSCCLEPTRTEAHLATRPSSKTIRGERSAPPLPVESTITFGAGG